MGLASEEMLVTDVGNEEDYRSLGGKKIIKSVVHMELFRRDSYMARLFRHRDVRRIECDLRFEERE